LLVLESKVGKILRWLLKLEFYVFSFRQDLWVADAEKGPVVQRGHERVYKEATIYIKFWVWETSDTD